MYERTAKCGHVYLAKGSGGRPKRFCDQCEPDTCLSDGCSKSPKPDQKYLCSEHYDATRPKCSEAGCNIGARAKGLCSTHYNKKFVSEEKRHPKVKQECSACGVTVVKARSAGRRPVCSDRCRYFLVYGVWPEVAKAERASLLEARRQAKLPEPASPSCEIPLRHPARWQWPSRWWDHFHVFSCSWCGSTVTALVPKNMLERSRPKYCSDFCLEKHGRGLRGRFRSSPAMFKRVTDRDGWDCQLCSEPVDPALLGNATDPWSPTLDHIVPRSMGGPDDVGNLRLAHRWCNNVRGAARAEAEAFFADMRLMSAS